MARFFSACDRSTLTSLWLYIAIGHKGNFIAVFVPDILDKIFHKVKMIASHRLGMTDHCEDEVTFLVKVFRDIVVNDIKKILHFKMFLVEREHGGVEHLPDGSAQRLLSFLHSET